MFLKKNCQVAWHKKNVVKIVALEAKTNKMLLQW